MAKTKLRSCLYCGEMFNAHWVKGNSWGEYCPECVKEHVWIRKPKYKISDEGVVIYEK